MSRIPPKPRDQLDNDIQRHIHDEVTKRGESTFKDIFQWRDGNGALLGPFPFYMASNQTGVDAMTMIYSAGKLPGLPISAREVAILVVGAHFQAAFELYSHTTQVIARGDLTAQQANALAAGEKPEGLDEKCEVAYEVAISSVKTKGPMKQQLWDRAVAVLGKGGMVALLNFIGQYCSVCVILNACAVPVGK